MLHSLEIPSEKGGTMFADMRAAYDALPDQQKKRLDGLTAVHGDATGPAGYRRGRKGTDPTHEAGENESRHPAIRVHPVSGRRVLFVNPMHTVGFEGMDEAQAVRLIEELAAHATQEPFVYYHQWKVGDVVMWDEASTMHRNAGDYKPTDRRVFMRTIVF
jgi:taurine dioxygenase